MHIFNTKIILLFIEFLFLILAIYKIRKAVIAYRNLDPRLGFDERVEHLVEKLFKNRIIRTNVKREILLFYYLFTRKKKLVNHEVKSFSYDQDVSYGGFTFAIIFALVLEGVGISFFLHNWQPVIAWIHLVLSVYAILFLIADYKAIVRNSIIIDDSEVKIKIGFRSKIYVNIKNIKLIQDGKINFERDKKRKDMINFTLLQFEEPNFEIILKEPILYYDVLGRKTMVRCIYLSVDSKNLFFSGSEEGIDTYKEYLKISLLIEEVNPSTMKKSINYGKVRIVY
ncbi:hypothetical protein ACOI1C_00400 [Bacillus sp. DJP31]|uniref:hypothetical protein n=1 Tax=Bacillus sp. DJP31 TaxID=3409789 RepID=UPI003BB56134